MGKYYGPPWNQRNPRAINAWSPPPVRPVKVFVPKPVKIYTPPYRPPQPAYKSYPPFKPTKPIEFDTLRFHNESHHGYRHVGDVVVTPDFVIRHQFDTRGSIIDDMPEVNPRWRWKR